MKLDRTPIQREDLPFLRLLFGTTRERELALTNFSEQEKADFVRQQFDAQHTYYQATYPQAEYSLVRVDGRAVGRLYVDRRPDDIRVLDVSLLPEWQGIGIGARLMKDLLREGAHTSRPVTLHVERNNPDAFRFYQRLGFAPAGQTDTHWFMSWTPVVP